MLLSRITNFFDKCRLISDEEMQTLWSRLLAGEGNSPGTYSKRTKRTVNLLASMDKSDAQSFKGLCSCSWMIGTAVPLIYDVDAPIYGGAPVFGVLNHLQTCGLISFEPLGGYVRRLGHHSIHAQYYGQRVIVEVTDPNNDMNIGKVLLSKGGQELALVCGSTPKPGFKEYVIATWRGLGYNVTDLSGATNEGTGIGS
jgi:Protein of unknown function (DUF2806)